MKDGNWFNAGICFSYLNDNIIYLKINLAYHERNDMRADNEIETYCLKLKHGAIRIGLQLCREIRFPEQWKLLAQEGAEIFFFLTNAIDGKDTEVGEVT